jgi:hypothetical protein
MDAYPFLYESAQVPGQPHSWYFIHRGEPYDDPANRVIEAYKWNNGYRIKLKIVGSDFTHPNQTADPLVQKITVKNDLSQKRQRVFDLLSHIRGRAEADIPKEPGLCFFGGFWASKATQKENVAAYFDMSHPDGGIVNLELDTDSDILGDATLLQRSEQDPSLFKQFPSVKVLRKGKAPLADRPNAEEFLLTYPSDNVDVSLPLYQFTLEGQAIGNGQHAPLLTFNLETRLDSLATAPKVPLTEPEALALWDAVSRTIRPRPNGF